MRRNLVKPVSKKFVFFIPALFLILFLYIFLPNGEKKITKNKSFEEKLEYTKQPSSVPKETDKIQTNQEKAEYLTNQTETKPTKPEQIIPQTSKITYDELLDSLIEYPIKDKKAVVNVVNKLLVYKGYPADTIQVLSTDLEQSKAKTQGSYMAGSFEFVTGNLKISEKILYNTDSKVLAAILVHEIDHFDKLAKICKHMGINNFQQLFQENNISGLNLAFWKKASMYANTNDIKAEYYVSALKRFLTQNNLELLSSYSDFYRLSENIRNPLEISAYQASDYVFNHYKIPITDGPMKQLTKKFNDVDWAVYNIISKDSLLKNERISIFDYFFLKAILNQYPTYKEQFNNCINNKNGDLTSFWLAFENDAKSFYLKGQMDNATFEKMLNLLRKTEEEVKKGITPNEIQEALKYKINTLIANLVYPNSLNNLKTFSVNYLKYIKQKNIEDFEQELKCILTLICIENELYLSDTKDISLYYLKIPEELTEIYNIQNKRRKFLFIYNNQAFKNKLNNAENEQSLLTELLNQNRLNIKIKS